MSERVTSHEIRLTDDDETSGHIVDMGISLQQLTSTGLTKYKADKLKLVIVVLCALLNTNGGKLEIRTEDSLRTNIANFVRMTEQKIMDFIGWPTMITHVKFQKVDEKIVFEVKESAAFHSLSYNLYLESETQILCVPCTASIDEVKEILWDKGTDSLSEVQIRSHYKQFVKGAYCGFHEGKGVQLKNLKASSSKCVTLGDRIASNKLPCYVSAFANQNGGHIYYGIREDGIVEGEIIPNGSQISTITRKVEKSIKKMIWSDDPKPRRGAHWDIFFEPVLDVNSNTIPLIYVVVISVAPYRGGVFADEPESYEIVNKELRKIGFEQWKMRLRYPNEHLPLFNHSVVQRCTWSSKAMEVTCTKASGYLQTFINDGNWVEFSRHAKRIPSIVESYDAKIGLQLVVLSKKVIAYYRKAEFANAIAKLEEFRCLLPSSKDPLIFQVIGLYLEAALKRCQCDIEASEVILRQALQMVEFVPAGLITAAIYSFGGILYGIASGGTKNSATGTKDQATSMEDITSGINDLTTRSKAITTGAKHHTTGTKDPATATTYQTTNTKDLTTGAKDPTTAKKNLITGTKDPASKGFSIPRETGSRSLCIRALEHLQSVKEYPEMKVDLEQKTRINLALDHLGCSLAGDFVKPCVDWKSVQSAKNHLEVLQETAYAQGYGLSRFRQIQFDLASSILEYRHAQKLGQDDGEKIKSMLRAGFYGAKRAQSAARECKFDELERYSERCVAVCTAGLTSTFLVKPPQTKDFLVELFKTEVQCEIDE